MSDNSTDDPFRDGSPAGEQPPPRGGASPLPPAAPAEGGQFGAPPPPPSGGQFAPPPPPSGGQFAPPPPPSGGQFAPPPPPSGAQFMPPPPPSGGQFAPPPPPSGGQFAPPPPPSGAQFMPPPPPSGGQFAPPQGQFGQPPAAPGQFGAPGNQPAWGANGQSGSGGAAVAKAMNPMDAGIIGAGVLALILSTFAYYVAKLSGNGTSISQSFSAWHGLFGWLSAVLAFLGAAVLATEIFAPGKLKLPRPARQIALTLFAVATLCVLLAFFIHPGTGVGSTIGTGFSAKVGHGFSYWASVVVIIAGTVLSYLRLKATGGTLPWEKSGTGRNLGGPGDVGTQGTGFPS